jgi:hypothetical protein
MNNEILFLCLYCDDSLLLVDVNLTVFERIQELYLSRTRKNSCPLAQNPQKILNSGTISIVQ